MPHRLLRALGAALVAVALGACAGGDGSSEAADDGTVSDQEAAEAEAEKRYGDRPGAEVTYAEIDGTRDCEDLQARLDRWTTGAARVDGEERREVLEAYVEHAEARVAELECLDESDESAERKAGDAA